MKTDYKFDNTKDRYGNEKHIHTLRGKPLIGTTTLIGELFPPPLTWWASGMAIKHLGWYDRKEGRSNYKPDEEGMPYLKERHEEIKQMKPKEYLSLLDEAYKAHNEYKKDRGDYGSMVHETIENAVKDAIDTNDGILKDSYDNEIVERFAKWGRGKQFVGSEVHVFSEKLWTGGILDLVYKEDDKYYLGDIKTSKSIYKSNVIQMGLYDYQQKENGFVDKDGKVVGKPKDIEGYTVINLPEKKKDKVLTFPRTDEMREFAENMGKMYKTRQNVEDYIKNKTEILKGGKSSKTLKI